MVAARGLAMKVVAPRVVKGALVVAHREAVFMCSECHFVSARHSWSCRACPTAFPVDVEGRGILVNGEPSVGLYHRCTGGRGGGVLQIRGGACKHCLMTEADVLAARLRVLRSAAAHVGDAPVRCNHRLPPPPPPPVAGGGGALPRVAGAAVCGGEQPEREVEEGMGDEGAGAAPAPPPLPPPPSPPSPAA